jgi:hypothetical protein
VNRECADVVYYFHYSTMADENTAAAATADPDPDAAAAAAAAAAVANEVA